MTKQTHTHRTQTGEVFTRTSPKPYEFVIVGTRTSPRWDGKGQAGDHVVLSWRTSLPASFGGREFSAYANLHAERINGGQA